jgi:nucleoside-diphosphate-sugar epimerase
VFANKAVEVFGPVDLPHSYSYTEDVAAGLVALGSRADSRGIWMLPVEPAGTTKDLVDRFARVLGRPIKTTQIPTFVFRAMGVFQPVMRELAEMTYQWKQPYVLDDSKFRNAFGFGATSWAEAIGATAAWAKENWETRAAA